MGKKQMFDAAAVLAELVKLGDEFFGRAWIGGLAFVLALILASPHAFITLLALVIWCVGWVLRSKVAVWRRARALQVLSEHRLIDLEGRLEAGSPYQLVRAPEHLARFLIIFSIFLASGSFVMILVAALSLGIFHAQSFYEEERHPDLLRDFVALRNYQAAVGSFWPNNKKISSVADFFASYSFDHLLNFLKEERVGLALSFLMMVLISLF